MLTNFDPTRPLYIVGTSVPAQEIRQWILDDTNKSVDPILIDKDTYVDLPPGSQCLVGFANVEYRKKLFSEPEFANRSWVGFIHPSSIITQVENVGVGTVIQPMVVAGFDAATNQAVRAGQSSDSQAASAVAGPQLQHETRGLD